MYNSPKILRDGNRDTLDIFRTKMQINTSGLSWNAYPYYDPVHDLQAELNTACDDDKIDSKTTIAL